LIRLPEKMRRALQKVVNKLSVEENIYGIGLFGSWSRSDATSSSDLDLLILDKGNFSHEYVERIETGDLFIDLDHIPKRWVRGQIPPEVDQKLYEMQVLYDRDWSLTNTKLLMAKSYNSPERVDIRAETHIVDSDIYLSRATSAFSREDYRSTHIFATVALESILKILFEISSEPFSNSHFIEQLERSTSKLGMRDTFSEYLEIATLNNVDDAGVKEKLRLFKLLWIEMSSVSRRNYKTLESIHFIVRTKLDYYLNPAFLQGTIMRASFLIASGKVIEASHYLTMILLDIVENYAWLESSISKVKVDYTTLIHSLEILEEKNSRNHEQIVGFLRLDNIGKPEAAKTIEKTRDIILRIRRNRKVLIKNRLIKG
jgi:predicted nucleotidyltransferase